jgi:hypothetical protein
MGAMQFRDRGRSARTTEPVDWLKVLIVRPLLH